MKYLLPPSEETSRGPQMDDVVTLCGVSEAKGILLFPLKHASQVFSVESISGIPVTNYFSLNWIRLLKFKCPYLICHSHLCDAFTVAVRVSTFAVLILHLSPILGQWWLQDQPLQAGQHIKLHLLEDSSLSSSDLSFSLFPDQHHPSFPLLFHLFLYSWKFSF